MGLGPGQLKPSIITTEFVVSIKNILNACNAKLTAKVLHGKGLVRKSSHERGSLPITSGLLSASFFSSNLASSDSTNLSTCERKEKDYEDAAAILTLN